MILYTQCDGDRLEVCCYGNTARTAANILCTVQISFQLLAVNAAWQAWPNPASFDMPCMHVREQFDLGQSAMQDMAAPRRFARSMTLPPLEPVRNLEKSVHALASKQLEQGGPLRRGQDRLVKRVVG